MSDKKTVKARGIVGDGEEEGREGGVNLLGRTDRFREKGARERGEGNACASASGEERLSDRHVTR